MGGGKAPSSSMSFCEGWEACDRNCAAASIGQTRARADERKIRNFVTGVGERTLASGSGARAKQRSESGGEHAAGHGARTDGECPARVSAGDSSEAGDVDYAEERVERGARGGGKEPDGSAI